jgi:hypothetical protein
MSSHTDSVLRDAEIQRKTDLAKDVDLKNNCLPGVRSRRQKLFHFLPDHFETLHLKFMRAPRYNSVSGDAIVKKVPCQKGSITNTTTPFFTLY